jgi:porin
VRAGLAGGLALLALAAAGTASAQDALDEPYPLLLDGTLSGDGDLAEDEAPHSGRFRFESVLGPWEAFKANVRDETGINFGGSWGVLWQNYSDPASGEHDAVGQKFTLNLSREMLWRGTPDALSLDIVIEDRGPIGTDLPPLQAGLAAGSLMPTAATWGDFGLGITQFYIRQNLFDNRFQYTIGKIFAPNFINPYPFFDDNRQFLNQTFSTSPTIVSPLRGFGAVAAVYPTDLGLYAKAGIYTPNSDDTGWTADSFFEDGEFFYHLELGWTALARTGTPIQARGPMDPANVSLTLWHKDEQDDAPPLNAPEAQGVAFNVNMPSGDNLLWFVRGGWSDGWAIERNLTAGLGWRPTTQFSDLFGIGVGWASPASEALDDQYTAEAFYRYHITPNLAITPDLQFIVDPTLNPAVDQLWVAGLRMRITF